MLDAIKRSKFSVRYNLLAYIVIIHRNSNYKRQHSPFRIENINQPKLFRLYKNINYPMLTFSHSKQPPHDRSLILVGIFPFPMFHLRFPLSCCLHQQALHFCCLCACLSITSSALCAFGNVSGVTENSRLYRLRDQSEVSLKNKRLLAELFGSSHHLLKFRV